MKKEGRVILVDGDSLPTQVLKQLVGVQGSIKRIFHSNEAILPKKIKEGLPGFTLILLNPVGKEAADKCLSMDLMRYYFEGYRHFEIYSNDHDMIDVVEYFMQSFIHDPVKMTLKSSQWIMQKVHVEQLAELGVSYQPFNMPSSEAFLKALEIIKAESFNDTRKLTTHYIAMRLRDMGVKYRKGLLKHDLAELNILTISAGDKVEWK